ncbi:MAG TPA: hypothetical protein VFI31_20510 [Pirellulales bacterium]|nr:hypothetical protein [Pirellulales bacterium]
MSRPSRVVACFVGIVSLGWMFVLSADDKKKEESDGKGDRKQRAADQLALAEQAVALGMEGFRASRIRLSDAQVERWSLRRIDALKADGASDKDLHKARLAHRDLMEKLEKLAESLFKSSNAAELDLLEARYARLEAERQLAADDDESDDDEDDDKGATREQRKKK